MERLMPMVYDELHRLAQRYLSGERRRQTLYTIAMVNEAFLLLKVTSPANWDCRTHFALCTKVMRRTMLDWARTRRALKHGRKQPPVELNEELPVIFEPRADLLAIDAALQALPAVGKRECEVVKLRFLGGRSELAGEQSCGC